MNSTEIPTISGISIDYGKSLPQVKTNASLNFNNLDAIGALLQDTRQLLEKSKSLLLQHSNVMELFNHKN